MKIKVHPLFYFMFVYALLSYNRIIYLFQLLFVLIHELSHLLVSLVFNYKIKCFQVLPFGFFIELYNNSMKCYQEFVILIMGPLSYFISLALIKFLYQNNLISLLTFQKLFDVNLMIVIFNLLIIYPLDGYHLFKIVLEHLFTFKIANKIMILLTIINLIILTILMHSNLLIISFLITNLINLIKNRKLNYLLFLSYKIKTKERFIRVHKHLDLYRPYYNILKVEEGIINQKDGSIKLIESLK